MFSKKILNPFNLVLVAGALVLSQLAIFAQGQQQQQNSVKKAPAARTGQRRTAAGGARGRQSATPRATPTPAPAAAAPPVALVNNVAPEYLSGEANVSVKGNQNPIIKLGLAQNGVNIIEFPAADSFFMIHPGNSDLVSFDEDTAKLSKRVLVFRPGAAFVAPPAGSATRGPSTSFGVQMQSGLVVTFLIYPVRDLSLNAHRVVVMYNREEVVSSRRAAGLAVNLDGRDPGVPKPGTTSVRLDGSASEDGTAERIGENTGHTRGGAVVIDVDSVRADERAKSGHSPKKKPNLSDLSGKALREVVKTPSKVGTFSRPVHGLSVAIAPAVDLDAQTRLVVVAVRNDTQAEVRIVPGNPEIYVQTFGDGGRTLQLEQVKKLHVESTSLDGKLAAGEVAYFAVSYEAPILGAQQKLRVSVSQTEAADEPATTTVLKAGAGANDR